MVQGQRDARAASLPEPPAIPDLLSQTLQLFDLILSKQAGEFELFKTADLC